MIVLLCSNIVNANGPSVPPPPPGLEEPPPVSIDLYMIPMFIIGIIIAFVFIRKNTNV